MSCIHTCNILPLIMHFLSCSLSNQPLRTAAVCPMRGVSSVPTVQPVRSPVAHDSSRGLCCGARLVVGPAALLRISVMLMVLLACMAHKAASRVVQFQCAKAIHAYTRALGPVHWTTVVVGSTSHPSSIFLGRYLGGAGLDKLISRSSQGPCGLWGPAS